MVTVIAHSMFQFTSLLYVIEFSTNVEMKYEAYMKERTEYLQKNKVNIIK